MLTFRTVQQGSHLHFHGDWPANCFIECECLVFLLHTVNSLATETIAKVKNECSLTHWQSHTLPASNTNTNKSKVKLT